MEINERTGWEMTKTYRSIRDKMDRKMTDIIDTKTYRYFMNGNGVLKRLKIEYVGTVNAINKWEIVK